LIRAMAWKEYREQRAVWVAMAIVTAFLILGPPIILTGGRATDLDIPGTALALAAVMSAAYGLICGSILFAGEEEFRTLPFLDRLTGYRTPLWGTKFLAGCGLVLAHALLIAAILVIRQWQILESGSVASFTWKQWLLGVGLLVFFSLEGLTFGMAVSVVCRNALSAAGLSVILYALSWNLTAAMLSVPTRGVFQLGPHTVRDLRELIEFRLPLALGVHALLAVFVLWVSWGIFCRDDLRRGLSASVFASIPVPSFRRLHERESAAAIRNAFWWRSVLWLVCRQAWPAALLLCLGSVALVSIIGTYSGSTDLWLVTWPLFSSLIGVICGLGMFLGEQSRGAERFLGDQRLPVGRIWVVKTGAWLLLAATVMAATVYVASFLGILPLAEWEVREGSASGVPTLSASGLFRLLWAAYGFAIGQFCARAIRKPVVAGTISLLLSSVAVIWWPSLICGGLSAWQVFAAPLVLLAATRIALWEWVAGGPYGSRSVVLIGSSVAAALCLAGGIEYRVWQVPNVGKPFDVEHYVEWLPTPQQNKAGFLTRSLLENLDLRWREAQTLPTKDPSRGRVHQLSNATDPLDEVLKEGWQRGNERLARQLDHVFIRNWTSDVRLPDMPIGMFADPNSVDYSRTPVRGAGNLLLAVRLLRARAVQLQAGGDRRRALDQLALALALIRNVQNHATYEEEVAALTAQTGAFQTFEKWLFVAGYEPELLRSALEVLRRHASEMPSFADHLEADYLVLTNTSEHPARFWFKQEALVIALQVPWERERYDRLLNAAFAGLLRAAGCSYPDWLAEYEGQQHVAARHKDSKGTSILAAAGWQQPSGSSLALDQLGRLLDQSILGSLVLSRPGWGSRLACEVVICRLRALELQVALALFQTERNRAARTLDELVPAYFPELPLDPFTGRQFGYRISPERERLLPLKTPSGRIAETRIIQAGQGVIWSAGPDAIDNGGVVGGSEYPWYDPLRKRGTDLVFLVPMPPVKRDKQ
jgi:hypothetical protein